MNLCVQIAVASRSTAQSQRRCRDDSQHE